MKNKLYEKFISKTQKIDIRPLSFKPSLKLKRNIFRFSCKHHSSLKLRFLFTIRSTRMGTRVSHTTIFFIWSCSNATDRCSITHRGSWFFLDFRGHLPRQFKISKKSAVMLAKIEVAQITPITITPIDADFYADFKNL